jgi:hypothetical protein
VSLIAKLVATDVITEVDGAPCRVWKGVTAGGTRFVAFINRVSVEEGEDPTEFEQLVQRDPPRELPVGEVLMAFSRRML